ncbi:MAG: Radical SAM domain protein [Microgenomates group bacterium GW2011_GWC1_44_10]|nr:MAG: Radical SAM domain protein [Microgenomates group bacterium GW2011_GWC1_44_10]
MKNHLRTMRSPFSVNLEVTPVCNLRCEFCFAESECKLKHPSLAHVLRIIDEIEKAGVFEIRLFGGEFFSYPKWADVARYAHGKGMFLTFVSNGTLITPATVKILVECEVKGGAISIHGPKAVHEKITKIPGSYNRALRGLKSCLDGGLDITVLTTFTQSGKNRIPELVEDLNRHGLVRKSLTYGINRLCPYGRGKEDWEKNRISLSDYLGLFPILEKIAHDYGIETAFGDALPHCLVPKKYHYLIQGCWQGTGFGQVTSTGDVRGCSTTGGSYGNLLVTPLEKIWRGKGLRSFRKLDWLPEGCQSCKDFCGGGCSASRPGDQMYSPDEFLEVNHEG